MAINLLRWVSDSAHALHAHMFAYAAPSGRSPRRWFDSQRELALELINRQNELLPGSPVFDPQWVDTLPEYRQAGDDQARCYAYATNRGEVGTIRPGYFSDRLGKTKLIPDGAFTPETLRAALIGDGLEPLGSPEDIRPNGWMISAFIRNDGGDFHFVRLEQGGIVADKPGTDPLRVISGSNASSEDAARALTRYKNPATGECYKFVGLYQVIPGDLAS